MAEDMKGLLLEDRWAPVTSDMDFYLPEGAPAWLVEKTGPFFAAYKQYTLAQAREHC